LSINIAWVIAEDYHLPPRYGTDILHAIGPIWSSWRIWRTYGSDNCVCLETADIEFCIEQEYHEYCNLYIPDSYELTSRLSIKRYAGMGKINLPNSIDIVTLHLAAAWQDIILLLGFDLSRNSVLKNYVMSAVSQYAKCQWVCIDNRSQDFQDTNLENFTCDSFDNVVKSLL